jgi:hypothetical protein
MKIIISQKVEIFSRTLQILPRSLANTKLGCIDLVSSCVIRILYVHKTHVVLKTLNNIHD